MKEPTLQQWREQEIAQRGEECALWKVWDYRAYIMWLRTLTAD